MKFLINLVRQLFTKKKETCYFMTLPSDSVCYKCTRYNICKDDRRFNRF